MDIDDDAPLSGGGDDLRSALASAFAGDGAGSEPELHTETEHTDTPVDGDAAAPAKSAVERARHPDGKFAPKPADAPAEGAETQPQAPAATPPETPAAPVATRPAPQSWSTENKQVWASLPPAIQDQVEKREAEVRTALETSANARKFTSAIEQIITPHAQLLQREGVDVPTAVKNLLSFHDFFDRDPAACIAHLTQMAAQRGVRVQPSPQGAAPQPPAAPPRQAPTPDPRQIVREELTAWQQQQALSAEISGFAQANPHFEAVKPAMALLIRSAAQAGQELSMQDAYDRAIWADPAIRPSLIAAQAAATAPVQPAAAQAPSAADQAARVARARQAGGSVRGAPTGSAAAKPGDRSLREELAANFHAR